DHYLEMCKEPVIEVSGKRGIVRQRAHLLPFLVGSLNPLLLAIRCERYPLDGCATTLKTGEMRRLYYAGGNMLMADSTCKAVLRYARALADANKADVIMIPVVTEGGSLAYAHMLVGPAS